MALRAEFLRCMSACCSSGVIKLDDFVTAIGFSTYNMLTLIFRMLIYSVMGEKVVLSRRLRRGL